MNPHVVVYDPHHAWRFFVHLVLVILFKIPNQLTTFLTDVVFHSTVVYDHQGDSEEVAKSDVSLCLYIEPPTRAKKFEKNMLVLYISCLYDQTTTTSTPILFCIGQKSARGV
jgi:hypothetical protein